MARPDPSTVELDRGRRVASDPEGAASGGVSRLRRGGVVDGPGRHLARGVAVGVLMAMLAAGCGGSDPDVHGDPAPTTEAGAGAATDDGGATGSEGEDGDLVTGAEAQELPPADGAAVPSPGCEADAPAGEVVKERHEVADRDDEGTARWYLLTAPAQADPVPLVVDFHGLSEGADIHTLMSEMGELGLEEGFATAFPSGTGQPVGWNVLGAGVDSPELPFVDAVLDDVLATRCIDTSRVYATGLSNGAMVTSMLACTRADRFAAFAPVAGLTTWDGCEPSRPAPILAFHGTADPILYFNGGIGDLSIVTEGQAPDSIEVPEADLDGEGYPETARQWAARNGCAPDAVDEEVTDEVLDRTWSCPAGAPVELVILVGGGHSWPGSAFSQQIETIVGPTTDDIHASEAMWEFFQRYQLPA